jgi:hypothetical protein
MAASAEEAASQTNIMQEGSIENFSGVEESVNACTTINPKPNYDDMPGMTLDFTLGGSTSEEVVVMFHATAYLELASGQAVDTGYVVLKIDGVVQTPSDEVPLISTDNSTNALTATYSFTWQSTSLVPGRHTALIQYRTDSGSNFCVDTRSLIILHR